MTKERITELEAMGFKRWQKNGMDRLYVNASVLGLECTFYRTGNVSNATFNGVSISNHEGTAMRAAKTYIDLEKNLIRSDSPRLLAAVADILGVDYKYGETMIQI